MMLAMVQFILVGCAVKLLELVTALSVNCICNTHVCCCGWDISSTESPTCLLNPHNPCVSLIDLSKRQVLYLFWPMPCISRKAYPFAPSLSALWLRRALLRRALPQHNHSPRLASAIGQCPVDNFPACQHGLCPCRGGERHVQGWSCRVYSTTLVPWKFVFYVAANFLQCYTSLSSPCRHPAACAAAASLQTHGTWPGGPIQVRWA